MHYRSKEQNCVIKRRVYLTTILLFAIVAAPAVAEGEQFSPPPVENDSVAIEYIKNPEYSCDKKNAMFKQSFEIKMSSCENNCDKKRGDSTIAANELKKTCSSASSSSNIENIQVSSTTVHKSDKKRGMMFDDNIKFIIVGVILIIGLAVIFFVLNNKIKKIAEQLGSIFSSGNVDNKNFKPRFEEEVKKIIDNEIKDIKKLELEFKSKVEGIISEKIPSNKFSTEDSLDSLKEDFKNLKDDVGKKIEDISKKLNESPKSPAKSPIFDPTHQPSTNNATSLNFGSTGEVNSQPIQKPQVPQRTFWLNTPQNKILKENSVYKIYECKTFPNDEDRASFKFVLDPSAKSKIFENENEYIVALADFEGIMDSKNSIINTGDGILIKKGDGWELEKKAKIKFV